MSNVNTFPRARASNRWTLRDALLVGGALALVVAATFALGQRDQIMARVGGNHIQAIARFTTADFHALAFKPDDPNIVYFGHHNGIMRSTNGGVDWKPILNQGDAMSLAVMPDQPNTVIAAGHLLLLRSDDRGATWRFIDSDLPYTDIHALAIDPQNPLHWFAFVVGYGLFRSEDGGAHWSAVAKSLPDTTMALVVVPANPMTVYAGTTDRGVLRSMDGGSTWSEANLRAKMAMTLTQDPRDPRIVYAGTEAGLMQETADGTRWEATGLNMDVMAVAISLANPQRMLVVDADGSVYRSEDGGGSWGN
jgi:photosystem II stability/assembly factor-like uncharacterized protein